MAIYLMEGMDTMIRDQVYVIFPGTAGSQNGMVAGRFGGQAWQFNSFGITDGVFCVPVPSLSTFTVGMAIYNPGISIAGSSRDQIRIELSGSRQFTVFFTSSGKVMCGAGSASTLAETADGVIKAGTYQYYEIALKVHNTEGAFQFWVDGEKVIDVSGVDTQGLANSEVTRVVFRSLDSGTRADDVYGSDQFGALGPQRMEILRPASDAQKEWTPNSGANNYTQVDDIVTDSDTTYVTAAGGEVDIYTLSDLSEDPTTITAVSPMAYARMDDVGPRYIKFGIRSGATDHLSPSTNLSSSYAIYREILETDPATGNKWTTSGVNGLLALLEAE